MRQLIETPKSVVRAVGRQARARRIASGRKQSGVAESAGISRATLLRFERTGEVRFDVVVRVAFALDCESALGALFPPHDARSLDEIIAAARPRRRVRS